VTIHFELSRDRPPLVLETSAGRRAVVRPRSPQRRGRRTAPMVCL